MRKSLVIVESPAKAKTVNKYLGKEYIVKSSIGHIRDLPMSSGRHVVSPEERAKAAALTRKMSAKEKQAHQQAKKKAQLVARMGVDPEHGWLARYEILPGKEKVVNELKKLSATADQVYLATDMDREGEAIAWHLKEAIGGDPSRYQRVIFNEITRKAIREAFEHPSQININRVYAQQARRFLDRVVGFMVSPLLWAKVARGLSAGRVQSVAMRLVVEREQAIRAFIPEEYWQVFANTKAAAGPLCLEVKKQRGKEFRPSNEQETRQALEQLQAAHFVVDKREDKPTQSRPSPPFITSTLQQAASTRLGFGVKKTMVLAQRLYEAGYITYMRTDSTHLSQEALQHCRALIKDTYGDSYLPEQANHYAAKSGAQEAHEAIRPSDVTVKPQALGKRVERDAQRLYELIWRQFVACQMTPATFTATSVVVAAGDFELRARGRVMRFDGFMKVLSPAAKKDNENLLLPDVKVGDTLTLERLDPNQHFTQPPSRYREASLVKELEKRGIGRPSTYASIISTIQERGYVRVDNRRFYAEKMGDIVTERLIESFHDLMDYSFTANMEKKLDAIAEGEQDWKQVLDIFYQDFSQQLDFASKKEGGMRPNEPTEVSIECPSCQRPMQIRTASTGVFLGCSGYALPPKERCKTTINLLPGDEAISVDADDEEESRLLRSKRRCRKCGTAMDSYLIDEARKLHVCGNNPDCDGFAIEEGQFKIKGYEGPTLECDKCSSEMQLKTGRFGKYFDCTNEHCKNTRKLLRSGKPAPPKMDPVPMPELACVKVNDTYVLRDGASGLFLAASQFPKNRETRAPLVEELLPHRAAIDKKYQHLLTAPTEDPEGRKTVIRYSRKTTEQYIQSEVGGKATGWKAFYKNGQWVAKQGSQRLKASPKKT